jgi:transcriptional regulator with PAS, ATPase and Fis domain
LSKKVKAISEDALKTLRAYRWPGNVRELENVIERILALIDPKKQEISIDDIPLEYVFANFSDSTPNARDLDEALVNYEKNLILKALRQNNWNRKQTAKALGITYGILKYKVRKFSIKVPGRVNPNPDPISPFSSKTQ